MRLDRPIMAATGSTTNSLVSRQSLLLSFFSSLAAKITITSVEWNPSVAAQAMTRYPALFASTVSQYVLPDLQKQQQQPPWMNKENHLHDDDDDYDDFYYSNSNATTRMRPEQRMPTVAVGRHATWQALVDTAKDRLHKGGGGHKLLVVGGNNKMTTTTMTTTTSGMSTEQALTMLRNELFLPNKNNNKVELWAVTDPNSPQSMARMQAKIQAGAHGFVTQPLLSRTAWDNLRQWTTTTTTTTTRTNARLVVGMALPRTVKSLLFWQTLLEEPSLLNQDDLFQSHVQYFTQPLSVHKENCSLGWVQQELKQLQDLVVDSSCASTIDGIHFMPLKNTKDLTSILEVFHQNGQHNKNGESQVKQKESTT